MMIRRYMLFESTGSISIFLYLTIKLYSSWDVIVIMSLSV